MINRDQNSQAQPLRARFAAVLLCVSSAITLGAQTPRPVVMISIDGLRPDAVTQANAHGLHIPNLRRFLTEGTYAEGVTGVVPTLTYPSHTTLVTGVAPSVHGILSNTTFDPLFRNAVGWYWYAEDEKAFTLWQAAHAKGIVTASVNWPVTVEAKGLDYNLPEYWRASTPDDLPMLRSLARPLGLQQELESVDGSWVDGNTTTVEADKIRTRSAITLMERHHPGFLTLHLSALDETEHLTSPFSTDSNRTLESIDAMVGQVCNAALAIDPRATIVVVSDHGFVRTDYRVNLFLPLLHAGLITSTQATVGVAPTLTGWKVTLWPAGGSAAVMLHDPADFQSRDLALKLLHDLAQDPANGIDQIIGQEDLVRLGGFSGAFALVVLKPPFQMGYNLRGGFITPAPSTGMHGYLPSNPQMRSSFFIRGDSVAKGRNLGLIDMRSIAPSIARLLGVTLPAAPAPLSLQ